MIADAIDQGGARDPHRRRTWVALVDGDRHQLDLLKQQARPPKAGDRPVDELMGAAAQGWII
ncbi:hypothetical protein [Streptomyces sp. NPDC058086]|uniref:hypothetical protein n=1 Tax=Streptomyces sp. NPDC058086 TaxID=3346334 RepID=UPI0036E1583C